MTNIEKSYSDFISWKKKKKKKTKNQKIYNILNSVYFSILQIYNKKFLQLFWSYLQAMSQLCKINGNF